MLGLEQQDHTWIATMVKSCWLVISCICAGGLLYGFLKKYSLNNHHGIENHVLLQVELMELLASSPPSFPRQSEPVLILTRQEGAENYSEPWKKCTNISMCICKSEYTIQLCKLLSLVPLESLLLLFHHLSQFRLISIRIQIRWKCATPKEPPFLLLKLLLKT
jgi:hypothetical protein